MTESDRVNLLMEGDEMWQPIETVPKDGTPVLGWVGNGGSCVRYVIVRNWGTGIELMELFSVVFQPDVTITHWMPIPAGPEAKP